MRHLFVFTLLFVMSASAYSQRDGINRSGEFDTTPLYEDLMLPNSGGVYRGITFDMSQDRVRTIESSRSTTSVYADEENELVITTDMGDDIMDFGDITYTFDEQGLYHIQVETYAVDNQRADQTYDKVKAFWTNKLGAGIMADDGFLEFEGKDLASGNPYIVAIQNIDLEDSPGLYMYIYIQ